MIEGNAVNAGARDPNELLKALAIRYGLIGAEEQIDDALWGFSMAVVSLCAEVADACVEEERVGRPGDLIRAELLDFRVREARSNGP
jgi:hypothetical protein